MRSRKHAVRTTATVVLLYAAGCSIAGSWKAVETTPQGAPFPINEVVFDPDGKYTASGLFTVQGQYDGNAHTSTGRYKQRGQKLSLSPTGGPTLDYRVRRRADGKLVMTFTPPGQDRSVTAVLAAAPK